MTPKEFSDSFDVLLNSYKRFKAYDKQEILDSIEFNEYEKSLFLTKAQEQVVEGLYTGRNSFGNSFEETEILRRYLSNLIAEDMLSPILSSAGFPVGVNSKSKFFTLPSNLWYITFEEVELEEGKCDNMKSQEVVPVTQDEYHRLKKNPFRGVNDRRALRLDLSDGVVEIVCKYPIATYYIRYIKKLKPIIVEELPEEVSINGKRAVTPCEVHESLHQSIVDLAVRIALQSKGVGVEDTKE